MNLLELQRENEALKLKLFWKEHSHEIMEKAMGWANEAKGGPTCSCSTCKVIGRYTSGVTEKKPCTFKPWFEQVLRDHNMSIGRVDLEWLDGRVFNSNAQVHDNDQHFSIFFSDWSFWMYGSKLCQANSVCDPELAKLERLLHYLNTLGE